ncbi:uncharacterized protein LOC135692765 isoform X1 [Rhopilema esculentum]|uniref:uncharacterized protein LOC135686964 n=1 Tax=Rhopilema esculentum TaxID=499914 RepID=UPI0031E2AD87
MSDSEYSSTESISEQFSLIDSSTDGDYEVVNLQAHAPYQDEPLALPGQARVNFEEDKDGIPRETLEARFEKRVAVNDWCSCSQCKDELLVGALEYRCCREVHCAIGKAVFDGTIDGITCIIQHRDYNALVNTEVLMMVGPLLKDSQGRAYKRRAGQGRNEYLRAVAYRWLIRWFCGYLGWDNRRPLPACIYHNIRTKFQTAATTGYADNE